MAIIYYNNVGKLTGPETLTNYYTDAACTTNVVSQPNPPTDMIWVTSGSKFTGTSGHGTDVLAGVIDAGGYGIAGAAGKCVGNITTFHSPADYSFEFFGHADANSNPAIWFTNATVVPGKNYNLSLWAEGTNGTDFRISLYDNTHGGYLISNFPVTTTGTGWQRSNGLVYAAPAGCTTIQIQVYDFLNTNPANTWYISDIQYYSYVPNAGTAVWLTVDAGGMLDVSGADGVFNPLTKQFDFTYNSPTGLKYLVSPAPTFNFGSWLQTKYSNFSFYPALPLGEQTLPDIVGGTMGAYSLEIRNSGGGLQAPVFPPQLVPHVNGGIDGNAIAQVGSQTAGRYVFQVLNSGWVPGDTVELYAELELGTSTPSTVILNDWRLGGGTANNQFAYRWYRAGVIPGTTDISSALAGEFDTINSALTTMETNIITDINSTLTSDFSTLNSGLVFMENTIITDINSSMTILGSTLTLEMNSGFTELSLEITSGFAGIENTILSSAFISEIASGVNAGLSATLAADISSAVAADILAAGAPLNINQVNPVTRGNQIILVQGDDYDSSTAQPIVFSDNGTWPSMSGAEVRFSVAYWQNVNSTLVLSTLCHTSVGPPQAINVPLTAAQTFTLTPGIGYMYDLRAKLTNNEVRSLVSGNLSVNQPITNTF